MMKRLKQQLQKEKKRKRNAGFTLVEVIISIAALGLICAVLLRLFVVAGDTNDKAANMQEAELLASSTIETLLGAEKLTDGLDALGFRTISDPAAIYEMELDSGGVLGIVIEDAGGDYPGKLYDISVTVMYEDKTQSEIATKKYEGRVR